MKHPWSNKPEGSAIYSSVVRKEQEVGGFSDHKEAAEQMAIQVLCLLDAEIRAWRSAFQSGKHNLSRMTPKEIHEALDRVSQGARHLLEEMKMLGLPANILAYHNELWPRGFDPLVQAKLDTNVRMALLWRTGGTHIHHWLRTLSDRKLLGKVAPKSPLRKANVKNPELNFVVRKIAQFFYMNYGETMPTTIERICAIEYPELQVTNNTISAILRNFDHTEI